MKSSLSNSDTKDSEFNEVLKKIQSSRSNAYKSLNTALSNLYRSIGQHISIKVQNDGWGKGVVEDLSIYIKKQDPTIKGFTSRNIWNMKQFFETYKGNVKLHALSAEISWTNNRKIMALKTTEEREFYLALCSKQNYPTRDLDKLISSSTYERTILADNGMSSALKNIPQNTNGVFKDSYLFDFLDLPVPHKEKDLSDALIASLKDFILELGSGFSFIGQEYRVQVGNNDYHIDLLFFHRQLKCLVAFELKTTSFKPEHLGQLEFYLEALDQDVKLPEENPSIGVLLCRDKNDEVVKYALNRSMSPTVISEYETKMIPKELLQRKLNEFYELLQK